MSFALVFAAGAALPAQQVPLRFEVRAWPAGVLLAGSVIGSLVPELAQSSLPYATCTPCDPTGLWGVDRDILGPQRPTMARLSDVGFVGASIAGGLLLLRSRRGQPGDAGREDLAVLAQAVGVAAAVTEWTKVLVHRPRPIRYGSDGALHPEPSNGLSFPSGHTSVSFAAAAAYASVLHRRGLAGRNRGQIVALFGTAAATGALRVAARKHFPTDVLAGAALGAAVGWLIPAVHATR